MPAKKQTSNKKVTKPKDKKNTPVSLRPEPAPVVETVVTPG